ncbi:MAG TPA: hypothetical protein VFZ43_07985 [Anaerolineales bacterium]
MSSCSHASLTEGKSSYMRPDAGSNSDMRESRPSYARDVFTHQTGQILLEIGTLFINIPPFNEHVDRNTGHLLISIGNKLRSRK